MEKSSTVAVLPSSHVIFCCEYEALTNQWYCTVKDEESGQIVPIEWVKPQMNFDNYLKSLLSIFTIATMDEWSKIMYNGMDVHFSEQGRSFEREQSSCNSAFGICKCQMKIYD